jgi:hypothetical protein
MGASCGSAKADEQVYKDLGISDLHAYSILDVKEVEGHRYVKGQK